MSNKNNEEEIVFKICKSVYGERWYVRRLDLPEGSPKREFLCKDGSLINELRSSNHPDTNYFNTEQDAIDTIREFYSVVGTIE